MTDGSRFWDRVADRYAAMPVRDEESYARKLQILRDLLSLEADVLEVGCGTGSTALALAGCARSWRGVDYSPRMVEIARGKAAAAGAERVAFDCAPLSALAGETTRYDAVLAMNLLHLLDDRAAALRVIGALLKPGGVFVSSTFLLGDATVKVRLILPLLRLAGFVPPMRRLTGEALVAEIAAAGFAVERRWTPGPNKPLFLVARKPV